MWHLYFIVHPTFVLVAFDNWLINENTTITTVVLQRPCRQRAAHVARAASAVAPVPFLNRITYLKSAILHSFPNFYTLMVDIFLNFFPFKSTYDLYEPWKVSWKSVRTFFRNPEHRHTDRQTRQLWMNEWKCEDFKCVWKPTESRLCLTHYVNKSSRWAK